MAFTGLVLGTVAWFILGVRDFGARWLGIGGAAVAATLGIVAAALETGTASSIFLGAFVAVIVRDVPRLALRVPPPHRRPDAPPVDGTAHLTPSRWIRSATAAAPTGADCDS